MSGGISSSCSCSSLEVGHVVVAVPSRFHSSSDDDASFVPISAWADSSSVVVVTAEGVLQMLSSANRDRSRSESMYVSEFESDAGASTPKWKSSSGENLVKESSSASSLVAALGG